MATLTVQDFLDYTDKMTRCMLAIKGDSGTGEGAGDSAQVLGSDWGLSKALRELEGIVLAWDDYTLVNTFLFNTHSAQTGADWRGQVLKLATLMTALNAGCRAAGLTGVTDANSFARYYNIGAGGPFTCLTAPDFRDFFYNATNGQNLDTTNAYSPAIANMGQRAVGGGFVDGSAVDTTKYAGVGRLQAVTTGWTGSSGTLSVAVSGYSGAGVLTTDTWTVTVAGNGTLTFTPGSVVKIVTDVTNITLPVGMATGTVVIAGVVPSGRTNPPA